MNRILYGLLHFQLWAALVFGPVIGVQTIRGASWQPFLVTGALMAAVGVLFGVAPLLRRSSGRKVLARHADILRPWVSMVLVDRKDAAIGATAIDTPFGGIVVVTQGLLDASIAIQRAILAHEAAHARQAHAAILTGIVLAIVAWSRDAGLGALQGVGLVLGSAVIVWWLTVRSMRDYQDSKIRLLVQSAIVVAGWVGFLALLAWASATGNVALLPLLDAAGYVLASAGLMLTMKALIVVTVETCADVAAARRTDLRDAVHASYVDADWMDAYSVGGIMNLHPPAWLRRRIAQHYAPKIREIWL